MNKMAPLEDVKKILNLIPLVGEGGMWATGTRSDEIVKGGQYEGRPTDRPLYGTIYYLLTPDSFSRMHVLTTDEVWYHHCGPAVNLLLIYPDGICEIKTLGSDLLNGELPQIVVPRGVWQGAVMKGYDGHGSGLGLDSGLNPVVGSDSVKSCGLYTLMSTSMAPAYCDSDFKSASYDDFVSFFQNSKAGMPIDRALELLKVLTSI